MGSARGRVLLTGATGFLGSYAIGHLLAAGYEVHAVARTPGPDARVSWHPSDLLDDRQTRALVEKLAPDHLVHLAWYAEHGRFWTAPENADWVAATLRLLSSFAASGGRRAVVAGSCAEYDWAHEYERCRELGGPDGEATPTQPAMMYGIAKHAAHSVGAAHALACGVSLAWARVFLLYGPGEDPRRLVPSVARSLLAGQPAETTDGEQVRDLMHVDDVAAGIVALLAGGVEGPVNVASGEGVAIRTVLELLAETCGRPDLLRLGALPRRAGEPQRLVAATGRLGEEVGFRPRIPLADGLRESVEWWRARTPDEASSGAGGRR